MKKIFLIALLLSAFISDAQYFYCGTVRRFADTTYSVSTPVTIGGMSMNVTNGLTYGFRYTLIYSVLNTGTGIKVSLTFPSSTIQSASVRIDGQGADGVSASFFGTINSSGDVVTSTATAAANQSYVIIIDGTIRPSADGQIVLKWGPEVNAAATLKQGSVGCLWIY